MNEENYGKFIAESGIVKLYNEEFPAIHYMSGIAEFDEHLGSVPFSETHFSHCSYIYENAIIFIMYKDKEIIKVALEKSTLISVDFHENSRIRIRSINKVSKALRTGSLGTGIAGALLTSAIGTVSDKLTDKIKGIVSKETNGTIYDLIFENNEGRKLVKLCCEAEYTDKMNKFFGSAFSNTPIDTTSKCYIATVCYGDSMAPEVIKFKEFRDNFLRHNYWGRKIISFYYKHAEEVSNKLKNMPLVNKLIRVIFLNSIYKLLKLGNKND